MDDWLRSTHILATLGFGCLLGWELSMVFAPAFPLLAFCDLQQAIFPRVASVLALALAYALSAWKADWVFVHRNRLFTLGSLLALVTVANTCANLLFGGLPFGTSVLAWVLIGGASGMVGTLLALLWSVLGSRVDIDTGIVQRISLPPLVASVLLFPFFDGWGRIACACLANIALAHTTLFAWCSTSVENHEFRLHPVDRFALRQVPSQVGFFFGSMLAYVLVFVLQTTEAVFSLVMVVLAIVGCAAGGFGEGAGEVFAAGGLLRAASLVAQGLHRFCACRHSSRLSGGLAFACFIMGARVGLSSRDLEATSVKSDHR